LLTALGGGRYWDFGSSSLNKLNTEHSKYIGVSEASRGCVAKGLNKKNPVARDY